ncbi:Elf1-domain-containing protein [Tilletiopsis washingtonensis]|uniref:Transcription elongation factor 1 homolog n=1 Tax=Tilletiopsis washingtonensis TaxID=58919 RepID=A0A316ZGS8_9BASI|nr:Elf1-domain-containing protein [Tilletiopsis washingtonensis]PWO00680.1 Elf1-domain-containing protein [Tilletiopsis washingtonensis]
MGKRSKSTRTPGAGRKKEVLDTVFTCLFCSQKAVSCKIDDATRIGYLSCGRCGQKFQCQTNPIMAAIDVYSEWIDATEEVNTAD